MTAPTPARRSLLLVEDNPGDADLVRESLTGGSFESFEIVHAASVAEAVAALAELVVDVILLDLGLPDGNGVGTVRAIREVAAELPIVVLTGVEDDGLALACIDAGAQDYVPKPQIQTHNLKRAIGYAVTRIREAQLRELERALAQFTNADSHTIVFEARLLALEMTGLLVDCFRVGRRWRFSEGYSS
jgi:CheY-like chemotaxis protein